MADDLEYFQEKLVEVLLGPQAADQFSKGDVGRAALSEHIPAIHALSSAYNDPSLSLTRGLNSKEKAAAYALYFAPINFAKIKFLLPKTNAAVSEGKQLRVLDYGCGPGTASLAVTSHFSGAIDILAIDRSAEALEIGRRLSAAFLIKKCESTIRFEKAGFNWQSQKYNLIIAANVLNELEPAEGQNLLRNFVDSLESSGILLILEPALQTLTRQAMHHRDWLLKNFSGLRPIFPCTRGDDCPMLKHSQHDWCHGELAWERPRLIRQFDELLGFNKHRIKYSAFIFQKEGQMLPGYRVVGVTRKNKTGSSTWLCGPDFYEMVTLPRKNRNEGNSDFQKSSLLDRIEVGGQELSRTIESQVSVRLRE